MKIRILPNAIDDLELGNEFYEAQHDGLGEYFITSLISDIESLKLYAGVHEKYQGFHRSISKRFPFAIYYRLERASVDVYAVLDCRRDPQKTDVRLDEENA